MWWKARTRWSDAAFEAEHGRVPGGRIAILGFGRLGSRQLTAESDLDLVVVYDFDPEDRSSDGRRPLDAGVYYNRLTQRLVAALTAPTRRGGLYEVDLRLRPSGSAGPVATSLPRFIAYLDAVLPRYRQFDDLHALLRNTVVPALQARAA